MSYFCSCCLPKYFDISKNTYLYELENATDKVQSFTFKNQQYRGKVVSVEDASNISVAMNCDGVLKKYKIKMSGYKTYSLNSKINAEKNAAKLSRDMLKSKILNKIVLIKCGNFAEYGKIYADIYLDEEHINTWMIDKKLGDISGCKVIV